ncbi:MAG: hypothetical protein R3C26_23525 [Calditrichia bacterium]
MQNMQQVFSIDEFEKRFKHLIDDDKFLKIKNAKRKATKAKKVKNLQMQQANN